MFLEIDQIGGKHCFILRYLVGNIFDFSIQEIYVQVDGRNFHQNQFKQITELFQHPRDISDSRSNRWAALFYEENLLIKYLGLSPKGEVYGSEVQIVLIGKTIWQRYVAYVVVSEYADG